MLRELNWAFGLLLSALLVVMLFQSRKIHYITVMARF